MADDRSLLYALPPRAESHLLPFRVSPFKGSYVRVADGLPNSFLDRSK